MRAFVYPILLTLLASGGHVYAHSAQDTGRAKQSLDMGWKFREEDPEYFVNAPVNVVDWKFQPATDQVPLSETTDWKPYKIGTNAFPDQKDRSAWFVTTLPAAPGPHAALRFLSAADNATVYLNGRKVAYHQGWDQAFDVPLAELRADGPNVVSVLVQNIRMFGRNEGGLLKPVQYLPDAGSFSGPTLPNFDDSAWRTVNVPHDYVAEGAPDQATGDGSHGYLPRKVAWYRRSFNVDAGSNGKKLWLEFDGIYRASQVWVNGVFVGRHESGYTSFYYDVTALCKTGKNEIAVRTDPTGSEGWWYEGGGIYRHVWLTSVPPVHVAHWGTFVRATQVNLNGGSSTMAVSTELSNESGATANVTLKSSVLDASGHTVSSAVTPASLPLSDTSDIDQEISVPNAKLWSPDRPSMYLLRTEVLIGGQVVDHYDTPFGIRELRFDPSQGLFINGKHVKVQGTANHQDAPVVGVGVPDNLWPWRIKKLQALGSNGYRSAHNPPAPAFLDACDKLGMLVIDENRHMGETFAEKADGDSPYADTSELASMMRRDRNHPCVFMWSLCNEEWNLQGSKTGKEILTAMKAAAAKFDTTRPIGAAWNAGGGNSAFDDVVDIVGWNYGFTHYASFHERHAKTPMVGTEIAAQNSTRGIYEDDVAHGHATSYDDQRTATWLSWTQPAQDSWKGVADAPFMVGGFVWTGFDYRGESGWGWPEVNGNWGMLDIAGFPKDVAWFYKAAWSPITPIVHLLPHWNWEGKEGTPIRVWVSSNADEVELFLNKVSLGTKPVPPNGHAEWMVPFAKGELEAVGHKKGGRLWGRDTVRTTGAPAALKLVWGSSSEFKADPAGAYPVEVEVDDEGGRIVPTSANEIQFSISGPATIVGTSNGDTADPSSEALDHRKAFAGRCLVLIRSTGQPGKIILSASSSGLKVGTLTALAK